MFDTNNKYINNTIRNQYRQPHLLDKWELPPGDILAPMAGITDSPFRRITRRFGVGLLYTECISAEGIRRNGRGSLDLARFEPEEKPIAVQLFGSEPSQFADAAAIIEHRFEPDMIDINCGCPVKRFVSRRCGGYLMQDPDLIGRIVEAVKEAVKLPVSVKLRSGYRHPDETAAQAAVAAEQAGASLVAVHARYVRKSSKTSADWDVIGRVKSAVRHVSVIGNGDIFSYADAERMKDQTGCDRAMIARWATGKPWIFALLASVHESRHEIELPSYRQRIDILLDQYKLALGFYDERRAVHRMRKHIGWYTHSMVGAAKLRYEIMVMEDPVSVIDRLNEFREVQSPDPVFEALDSPEVSVDSAK